MIATVRAQAEAEIAAGSWGPRAGQLGTPEEGHHEEVAAYAAHTCDCEWCLHAAGVMTVRWLKPRSTRRADMNITISVPGGHQTAEITARPGGGGSVIEVDSGQQQAAQAAGRPPGAPG